MRVLVFFDLPNIFSNDRKNYTKFRNYLLKEGFIMNQESVYSKLVLNHQQSKFVIERLKKHSPPKGIIQVLVITEKQYANIEYIIGKTNTKIINSEDRLIVLWN